MGDATGFCFRPASLLVTIAAYWAGGTAQVCGVLLPVQSAVNWKGDSALPCRIRERSSGTFFDLTTQYLWRSPSESVMKSTNRALLGQEAKNLPISDEEIVRRVRAGESGLFAVVMRRYNERLYRVARAILRDDAEAEDVMQQAYLNAYLHLDQFANRATFSTWLTKIAVHEALARVRRRRRFDETGTIHDWDGDTMNELKTPEPDPERQAFAGELRALIESAIETLPGHYRAVFVMREVEGMSTAETAECLDITEETAKTRLHRARTLLREDLYRRAGVASASAFPFQAPRCDRVVLAVLERIEAVTSPDRAPNPPEAH
jgi:RNA polymerase sigma-70 factor (ECF subfamily)